MLLQCLLSAYKGLKLSILFTEFLLFISLLSAYKGLKRNVEKNES